MPTRRFVLLGALALGGCASAPAVPTGPITPLTLDQAFVGRQTGRGLFRVYLTGSERRFTAQLNGHLSRNGKRLTVVEDFAYDDGEKNRLTWVFDRTGPGTWTGRREDTVGLAQVTEEGGVAILRLADTRQTVTVLWDDQKVLGGHRGNVAESEAQIILVNDVSRNLFCDDFVENSHLFGGGSLRLCLLVSHTLI